MKKWMMVLVAFAAVMLIAPSAFAQETGAAAAGGKGLLAIAAGFGMALAAFGGALGQGRIASAACEGMARNPGPAAQASGPFSFSREPPLVLVPEASADFSGLSR